MDFISNLWKVHRPEFEKPGYETGPVVDDKPAAKLPDADGVAQGVNADVRNDDDAKQVGVAIAQATYAFTGVSWYVMMVSILVMYWVFAMDNNISYQVLAAMMATRNGEPTSLTAQTIHEVIAGVSKLVFSKVADIYGRFTTACISLFFYCLGFLILAVAQNNATSAAGYALKAVGNGGTLIILWIILADFLSSRMRALGTALMTMPLFITFATVPMIFEALAKRSHYRWGFGMFCIIIPVVWAPIAGTLLYLEMKAKRNGLVPKHPYLRHGFLYALKEFLLDIDIGGMILVLAGFIFLLTALNQGGTDGWSTPWIIALLVVGGFCIIALPFFECFISPRPFIRRRWLNSSVVIAMLISLFDFMSFQISFFMLYSWRSISLGMNYADPPTNYFTYTDTLCLTLFGVVAGIIILFTRRYKPVAVTGAAIRLIAYGLMIRYRHPETTMVQAVWPQILLGWGGGFVGDIITISSQVTVRHQDVAMVTAVVMLFQSVGQGIGVAIFQSIVVDAFPRLYSQRAGVSKTQAVQAYFQLTGSYGYLTDPAKRASPEAQLQIRTWNDAAVRALWAGIVFSAVVFILTLFLRDYVLTRSQNVVSDELPEKNPLAMNKDSTYDHAIENAEAHENHNMTWSQSEKTMEPVGNEYANHGEFAGGHAPNGGYAHNVEDAAGYGADKIHS